MSVYTCSGCQFTTTLRSNYTRHLTTNKHKKQLEITKNLLDSNFHCKYCSKSFTCKNAMYRHTKHRCDKNEDYVKDLVITIQSEKIKQLELQLENTKQLKIKQNDKFQPNNILPYRNTDTSHLTDEDFIQCVNQPNCVKHLIEKIHFNPTKPENMNVYITNLKDKYMMIYDGTWKTEHKTVLNKIYYDKEYIIREWLENDKYPEIKQKFMKYLNQIENDETLNQMKEEIKLMMYNQKDKARRLTDE